jgi:hypothetical protein
LPYILLLADAGVIVGRLIPAGTGSVMNDLREVAGKRQAHSRRARKGSGGQGGTANSRPPGGGINSPGFAEIEKAARWAAFLLAVRRPEKLRPNGEPAEKADFPAFLP